MCAPHTTPRRRRRRGGACCWPLLLLAGCLSSKKSPLQQCWPPGGGASLVARCRRLRAVAADGGDAEHAPPTRLCCPSLSLLPRPPVLRSSCCCCMLSWWRPSQLSVAPAAKPAAAASLALDRDQRPLIGGMRQRAAPSTAAANSVVRQATSWCGSPRVPPPLLWRPASLLRRSSLQRRVTPPSLDLHARPRRLVVEPFELQPLEAQDEVPHSCKLLLRSLRRGGRRGNLSWPGTASGRAAYNLGRETTSLSACGAVLPYL